MDEILKWLGEYSLPVVILLAIGGALLFVFQKAAEKAVEHAFDRHAKEFELRLTRRSAFEEKVLIDRYTGVIELNGRLDGFMTMTKRIRSGQAPPEGFYSSATGKREVVPLTAIYEALAAKRLSLTEEFHSLLWEKAGLALLGSNIGSDPDEWNRHEENWIKSQEQIRKAFRNVFKLDNIEW
jgi:hypothetical protein